jgi:hypothetical protein
MIWAYPHRHRRPFGASRCDGRCLRPGLPPIRNRMLDRRSHAARKRQRGRGGRSKHAGEMSRLSGSIATSYGCLLSRIGDVSCGAQSRHPVCSKAVIRCGNARSDIRAGRRLPDVRTRHVFLISRPIINADDLMAETLNQRDKTSVAAVRVAMGIELQHMPCRSRLD